jgi:hypothetical protein
MARSGVVPVSPHFVQPRVRVYVPTYRRHATLSRALESLRQQTLADWVCEVHNDDPSDDFPCDLVARLGDERIGLRTHERNLGCVATFNLFCRPVQEPFYTLLEDDNWWEPAFLERMVAAMTSHPEAVLAWCNQSIWVEGQDGTWRDSGRTVRPQESTGTPRPWAWGDPRQALGSLHANGAMLVRSRPGDNFETPMVPQAAMEAVRERMVPHPLLYVPEPLACFAVTQATSRGDDRAEWSICQMFLLASFVLHGASTPEESKVLWDHYRNQATPSTNTFLFAALMQKECRPFLAMAGAGDWSRFLTHIVRHPVLAWRVLRATRTHDVWRRTLDRATSNRVAERAAPRAVLFGVAIHAGGRRQE